MRAATDGRSSGSNDARLATSVAVARATGFPIVPVMTITLCRTRSQESDTSLRLFHPFEPRCVQILTARVLHDPDELHDHAGDNAGSSFRHFPLGDECERRSA